MPPKGLCIKGLVPRLVFWGGDVVFKWWDQVGGLDYLGEGVLKWVSKTLALCSVVFCRLAMKYIVFRLLPSCWDTSLLSYRL